MSQNVLNPQFIDTGSIGPFPIEGHAPRNQMFVTNKPMPKKPREYNFIAAYGDIQRMAAFSPQNASKGVDHEALIRFGRTMNLGYPKAYQDGRNFGRVWIFDKKKLHKWLKKNLHRVLTTRKAAAKGEIMARRAIRIGDSPDMFDPISKVEMKKMAAAMALEAAKKFTTV